MRGGSSKRARWSGRPCEALYFIAALSAAVSSLPACGARTGLSIDEDRAPARPAGPCVGWEGELFLAPARGAPQGAKATAMDLYPSNGDGTFGEPVELDVKEPFAGVVIDDFDRDGFLEIHYWGLSSGGEYVLDYSCDLGKWVKAPVAGGDAPPRHDFSSIGDVNNDGYIDVVGWVPEENGDGEPNVDAFDVYASLGGPNGAFTHSKESAFNLKDKHVWWLAATQHIRDMDGDGCADLIFIRYDHGGTAKSSVYLAKGDCAGGFDQPEIITSTSFPGTGDDIGDVDGDGHMDLITGLDDDGDPGQTWVLKGDGAGSLGSPSPVFDVVGEESGHDGAGFGSVFLYDWDHDGKLDALSAYTTGAEFSGPQIDIRMNMGNLTFGAPSVVVPAPYALEQWFVGPASIVAKLAP